MVSALSNAKDEQRLEILEILAMKGADSEEVAQWADKLLEEAGALNNYYYLGLGHHYKALSYSNQGLIRKGMAEHLAAIQFFKKANRLDKVARQQVNLGNRYADMSNYDSALISYQLGEKTATQAKDSMGIYAAWLNISTIHHVQGDRESELEYLMRSKAMMDEMGDVSQSALIAYNMAVFYIDGHEIDKALELATEANKLYVISNDLHGMASVLTLLAQVHFDKQEFDSAMVLLDQAIELHRKLGEKNRVGLILMNQGAVYAKLSQTELGFKKTLEAKQIFIESSDLHYVAKTSVQLAHFYKLEGRVLKAIEEIEGAIEIAQNIDAKKDAIDWMLRLSKLYAQSGQYDEAFGVMIKRDSLNVEFIQDNSSRAIAEMEATFQTERKQLEIDNLQKEKKLQSVELEHGRIQRIFISIGLALALIIAALIGYGFVLKRRDNKIITKQKTQVELRNAEIAFQKELVEVKNKEIVDSITYAQRIQQAILPSEEFWASQLPESFVLYKPKDIVAGDFYWMEVVDGSVESPDQTVIFAAADCTGHGVPGALMSVVCHNALNRAVREFQIIDPAAILDKTRALVIESFKDRHDIQTEELKDGMDISLCVLNKNKGELLWAGANNPIWIVSARDEYIPNAIVTQLPNKPHKLFELKPDKQPIGNYELATPFRGHTIQLMSGDSIYVFSDGYADQFGGQRGKKLKQSAMRDLILSISQHSMKEQKVLLNRHFEEWCGEMEQLDDICVIGLRV